MNNNLIIGGIALVLGYMLYKNDESKKPVKKKATAKQEQTKQIDVIPIITQGPTEPPSNSELGVTKAREKENL